jgi:hypothetical protein
MILYGICILIGIIAARWLLGPLAALLRGALFLIGILAAYWLTAWIVPEVQALDWHGLAGGGVIGLLIVFAAAGSWFYMLGWRGRVAATEADEHERARQKAIKDRQTV